MANNTKAQIFDELQHICELDDTETIFHYLCDYFTTDEVAGLLEHIKEEKGNNNLLNSNDDDDNEN